MNECGNKDKHNKALETKTFERRVATSAGYKKQTRAHAQRHTRLSQDRIKRAPGIVLQNTREARHLRFI
ncbi:hypothetical protein AAFF_G00126210 [Aldrovandia affinis]|uniref:Uncharacterized protein n=1 Tax=Aldrovandia affinis TaxID=143900 RepID=A0AAD7RRI8_9TELE|nr:hypothetical protein AAFF_G00126210 [Aldrovandia affinis]